MNQINIQYHKTRIGELILGSFQNKLCLLDFKNRQTRKTLDNRLQNGLNAKFIERNDDILQITAGQIDEYLIGKRKKFEIPIIIVGTDFQKSVWNILMQLQYGETASYLDIAKKVKNEKAVRAVANAIGANALGLIIPCHRIIGSNNTLGGYAGGLSSKIFLLELEKIDLPN